MADIISFNSEYFDFEQMIEEVEILIPQYMDTLNSIKEEEDVHLLPGQVRNIVIYWERLSQLFEAFSSREWEENLGINFGNVKLNTLQTELEALQSAYLKVHKHICFDKAEAFDPSLWEVSKAILNRMMDILNRFGFEESHKDRRFVKKMQSANMEKELRYQVELKRA